MAELGQLFTLSFTYIVSYAFPLLQELRSLEAELDDKRREQRLAEERLRQREAELAEREIDLLQRELKWMIRQQNADTGEEGEEGAPASAGAPSGAPGAANATTPTPKKRKGNFKRSRLKLLKKDSRSGDPPNVSSVISAPSGRSEKKQIIFVYLK